MKAFRRSWRGGFLGRFIQSFIRSASLLCQSWSPATLFNWCIAKLSINASRMGIISAYANLIYIIWWHFDLSVNRFLRNRRNLYINKNIALHNNSLYHQSTSRSNQDRRVDRPNQDCAIEFHFRTLISQFENSLWLFREEKYWYCRDIDSVAR